VTLDTFLRLTRLSRPIGIWLLLFPCWWGIALASPKWPPLALLLLFACGATLMRSAGCVYNDMIDKNFDAKVKRTAIRPLATGEVSSKEALFILFFLLAMSALILFSLPLPVIMVGFVSLALVLLYPWMKRITYWPQLFLGLAFNIGVLMGWLSLYPTFSLTLLLFYGGGIFWTIGYDTIYAFQDLEDDILIGVKSSAIVISSAPKLFLSLFYGVAVILWGVGGKEAHLGWVYWLFLTFITLHFAWQILALRKNNANNCLEIFKSNTKIGFLLFLGIFLSHLIR
jgi:4-hydroxybenzoate polyprenyltransferase